MKRRNFLKTAGLAIAGLFGFKTAAKAVETLPGAQDLGDDQWIPYYPVNGKGKVRVIFNHGPHIAVEEYESNAENLPDVPRQALEKHPYAFDIQLKQDGKTVYQWMCQPRPQISMPSNKGEVAITEWVWEERRFAKNGMSGPWVTSYFKGDPLERRVFYVDAPEGKAEKFLVALKEQFAKRRVA